MIHAVMLNLGNGDIDIDNNSVSKSFTYDYLVITDHTDTPQYIYAHAKQHDLPVSGDVSETGIKLKSIGIQRWDENNAKAVPSYHLPKKSQGSYAVWKYQVTYSEDGQQEDISFSGNSSDYAQNFSASIKQYQQSTYLCYTCTQNQEPPFATYTKKSTFLLNILKQSMAYDHTIRNLTISFDFKIKSSKIEQWVSTYIPDYVGSVNAQDVSVAGLKLRKGRSKINTMSLTVGQQYSTVHVEIQITIQKPVAMQVFPNVSQYAIPQGGEIPLRVHKWSGGKDTLPKQNTKGVVWFDRERGLGNFSENKTFKLNTDYQMYDKKVILKKDGTYYKSQSDTPPNLQDSVIAKTYTIVAPVKSWKSLDLPRYLK